MKLDFEYTLNFTQYKHSPKATDLSRKAAIVLKIIQGLGILDLLVLVFAFPRASTIYRWYKIFNATISIGVLILLYMLLNRFVIQKFIQNVAQKDYMLTVTENPNFPRKDPLQLKAEREQQKAAPNRMSQEPPAPPEPEDITEGEDAP